MVLLGAVGGGAQEPASEDAQVGTLVSEVELDGPLGGKLMLYRSARDSCGWENPPPGTIACRGAYGEDTTKAYFIWQIPGLFGVADEERVLNYTPMDITATAGSDYTASSGSLTIPKGYYKSQRAYVYFIDDSIDEDDEVMAFDIDIITGFGQDYVVFQIVDNDDEPSLSIGDDSAAEDDGPLAFVVTLDPASGKEVTVDYATADGTAGAPGDYATNTGTLTFAAGVTTATISVALVDDNVAELDEDMTVTLSNAVNASIGTGTGTGTILDTSGVPGVSIADATGREDTVGNLSFAVTLNKAATSEVTVSYATADGTATAGSDYTATSGTLTFPVGTTELTVSVPVLPDTLSEDDEDLSVTLGSPTNVLIADGTATGTIEDDEPRLVIADGEASEGSDTLPLVVSVSGIRGTQIFTVDYDMSDGTAQGGADFTSSSGTLTFAVGVSTATIEVPLIDDTIDEDDETFTVTLSNPVNATVISGTATATIRDDDEPPDLSVADATAEEGANAGFEVTLETASVRTVMVDYRTSNGTARAPEDFVSVAGTLTFTPGTTAATITVQLTDDALDEDDETFTLMLDSPVAAGIDTGTATGTITDNDDQPSVSVTDATGMEGSNADFVVELSAVSGRDVTVDYASSDGTAVGGSDFVSVGDTLTIGAGAAGGTISVALVDDALDEAEEETFDLEFTSVSNATVLDGSATGTIEDNDDPPVLTVADAAADEGDPVAFEVVLEGATAFTVTVAYSTAGYMAQESRDFEATSGVLTFTPGETTHPVSVSTIEDTLDEDDETFSFVLSSPTNATLGDIAMPNGTIRDDDDTPTLQVTDASGDEGGVAAFEVSLSAASGRAVTVAYSAVDGTAVGGEDYGPTSGGLTFTPGLLALTVEVPLIDDTLDEPDETFELRLASPMHARFGDRVGMGGITDNDDPPALSVLAAAVEEGETAAFGVTLSAPSGLEVAVSFATTEGSASHTDDFASTRGVLTFAPGVAEGTISVYTVDDALDEPEESFELSLSMPANATISTGTATGTIADNDDAPAVGIADAFAEEGTTVVFDVTLDAASSRTVGVSYTTADGTAQAGADYTMVTGELTFDPGATTATVSVALTEDDLEEPDETFTMTITGSDNATIQGSGSAQGRIIDNDGAPQIAIRNATGTEGGRAEFEVTLVGSVGRQVTVSYETRELSAREGEDFEAAAGTLTFERGMETTATIPVTLIDDAVSEPDEMFEVVLSTPVNATVATGVASGTILDNDAAPTVSVSDASGEEGGVAVFTLSLSGATSLAVTVRYSTLDGTAHAGSDYEEATGSVSFAPGETTRTVAVVLVDDADDESDETFLLRILAPVNAAVAGTSGTGTIRDNDVAPSLSVAGGAVVEGDTMEFEILLSGTTSQPVTVDYATSQGTAVAGVDYEPTSGSVRFGSGVSRRKVSVHTLDDDIHEPDETMQLELSSPVNATVASATAEARIVDNDAVPTLTVSGAEGNEGEIIRFRVTLAGSPGQTVTVDYATAEGTASAGTDYETVSGTLTFTSGVSDQEIPVRLLQDLLGEPDETFELRLSSPVNATVTTSAATATIRDDDGGIPVLSAADASVVEGGTLVFDLALNWPAGAAVTLDYRTEDGSALVGTDYTAAAGTLTIEVGETSAALEVQTIDDDVRELQEELTLRISASADVSVASAVVTGTILDNDVPPELAVEGGVAVEGEDAVFVVTLIGAVTRQVMVDYATMSGTAQAGEDFESVSGTLTFSTGTAVAVVVPTVDDDIDEPVETLGLSLTAPVNAEMGVAMAISTIEDNDAPPTLSIADAGAVEGGTARFPVALSSASGFEVRVSYATSDGTAVAGADYESRRGSVAMAPGETTTTIPVPLLQDDADEPDEHFTVTLSGEINAALADATAEGSIIDDDEPEASVAVAGGTATEGDTIEFTVALDMSSSRTVTVDYATAGGTAEEGADYEPLAGTLTFTPGDTIRTVAVSTVGDDVHETDETFTLELSMVENAAVSSASATGTIVDDDAPPELAVTGGSAPEGGTVGFAVTLTGATSLTVTVVYATTDGTAVAGDDYVPVSGTLTFAPGASEAAFEVSVVDDDVYEPEETFEALLSSPVNATLATPAATGTILDDDEEPATVAARPPDPLLCVGGDPVVVDLAKYFGGTSLRYSAESADASVATVELSGSVLTVAPASEGRATLHVSAANDSAEVSLELTATVVTDPAELAAVEGALAGIAGSLLAEIVGGIGDRFVEVGAAGSAPTGPATYVPRERDRSAADAMALRWDPMVAFGGTAAHGTPLAAPRPGSPTGSPIGSFSLSTGADGGSAEWSVWGRGGARRFQDSDGPDLDGSLEVLQIGADRRSSDWILGASAAVSRAGADYRFVRSEDLCGGGTGEGVLETDLTSIHPYAGRRTGRGWVWATLGWGGGEATLKRCASGRRASADVELRTAALGGRHRVGTGDNVEISLVEDIGALRAETAAVAGPAGDRSVSVGRARLGVELSTTPRPRQAVVVAWARTLARHDWGDGVQGTGLEVAAGARLRIPCRRFGLDASVHTLAVHSAEDHEEHGADVSASLLPRDDGSGIELTLGLRRGAHTDLLSGNDHWHGGGARGPTDAEWHREAYLGYGRLARWGVVRPFVQIGTSGDRRTQRVGLRIGIAEGSRRIAGELSAGRRHRSHGDGLFLTARLDARL